MSFEIKKKESYDPGYPSGKEICLSERKRNKGLKKKLSILAISATLSLISTSCYFKTSGDAAFVDLDVMEDADITSTDLDNFAGGQETVDYDTNPDQDAVIPDDEFAGGMEEVDYDLGPTDDDSLLSDDDSEDDSDTLLVDDDTEELSGIVEQDNPDTK